MVRAALAVVGLDVAIGYGVFAVLGLFVALLSTGGFVDVELTLADLLSGDLAQAALGGGGTRGVVLMLLATATVAVPVLWRHRLAPLAFAFPLLVTLAAFWPLYVQHRRQQQAVQGLVELGQAPAELTANMHAALGGPLQDVLVAAWVLFVTVTYLAVAGTVRVLRSQPASR